MAPVTGTEMIRIQQRELVRRAEAVRRRREAKEGRGTPPLSYAQVMHLVDEASVAARLGSVADARRLYAVAYGFVAPQVAQRP